MSARIAERPSRDPQCTDTNYPICPHCRHEHQECWDWPDGVTTTCSNCEKKFTMERYTTVTYNTVKAH